MEELIAQLRLLQANTFIYYTKAHGYHWNVEGILFDQFHEMFGEIYNDAWSAVDDYAEWIRIFGSYPDFDAAKIATDSTVKYDLGLTNNAIAMLQSLAGSNDQLISNLKNAFNVATSANEQGVADFIAGRLAVHQKWSWKIKSSIKTMMAN